MAMTAQRGGSTALDSMREFRAAIESGVYAPVYLFTGSADLLKEEALRQLMDRAVDPGTRDFNVDVFRGAECDADALSGALDALPLMASRRLLIVRDAGALKKDARAVLERHLERPSPETLLVLVMAAGTKADAALSGRAVLVNFETPAGKDLSKWIIKHAQQKLGATVTPEAATLLQRAVGDDLAQIAAELDKLASFRADAPIDEDAVAEMVGVRHGETMSDLLDAVASRDAARSLALIEPVLRQPKTSAVQIIMALGVSFVAMAYVRARLDARANMGAVSGEVWEMMKSAGSVFTGRPWGDAVNGWLRDARGWSAQELDRAIDVLLDVEAASKDTRVTSDEQLLAELVLRIVPRAGGAAA